MAVFDIFKCEFFHKSKFEASKNVKMAVFDFLKAAKLISHKIRVAEKLLYFHTVYQSVTYVYEEETYGSCTLFGAFVCQMV